MKNVFLSIVLAAAVICFFSFSVGKNHLITEQYSDDADDEGTITDTFPHVKDTAKFKKKMKTQPYDSFGKPKKMDSLRQ